MAVQARHYTAEEFYRIADLPENADRRFELIWGAMIEKMPTQLHAYIVQLISGHLFVFLSQNPIGWALVEARYQLPEDVENARVPDLSFVNSAGRTLIEEGSAPYMPDLAVAVQSPGQSDKLMLDKAQYYLSHGTRMVWLVYPQKRLVEVLTPDSRALLTLDDSISGGEVLPGFSLGVREIFPAQ
jgi:Uma2 family endonuclease